MMRGLIAGLLALAPAWAAAPPGIERAPLTVVPTSQVNDALLRGPGTKLLILTSYDERCPFCMRANPKYLDLAVRYQGQAKVLLAHFEPWQSVADNAFFQRQNIGGLPYAGLYVDGVLRAEVKGDWPEAEMLAKLALGHDAPAAAPAGAGDMPDLMTKIDNVKLLAEPAAGAKVVGLLKRSDTLVYLDERRQGFVRIASDLGEGWVDLRLLKPRQ